MVYGNLKSENSPDYAQKPQWKCTIMNSASVCAFVCTVWGLSSRRLEGWPNMAAHLAGWRRVYCLNCSQALWPPLYRLFAEVPIVGFLCPPQIITAVWRASFWIRSKSPGLGFCKQQPAIFCCSKVLLYMLTDEFPCFGSSKPLRVNYTRRSRFFWWKLKG
jgi:hypothetical protein